MLQMIVTPIAMQEICLEVVGQNLPHYATGGGSGGEGGEDGRFQTKLLLRVSNNGNGKFSLFTSGVEGVRAGKRPAESEENTSEKKIRS